MQLSWPRKGQGCVGCLLLWERLRKLTLLLSSRKNDLIDEALLLTRDLLLVGVGVMPL